MNDSVITTDVLDRQRPQAQAVERSLGTAPRFEERLATPFIQKSLSEETREAYQRGIREFFADVSGLHPTQVTPEHVVRYRDRLVRDKRKPSTIAAKLSIVRPRRSWSRRRPCQQATRDERSRRRRRDTCWLHRTKRKRKALATMRCCSSCCARHCAFQRSAPYAVLLSPQVRAGGY